MSVEELKIRIKSEVGAVDFKIPAQNCPTPGSCEHGGGCTEALMIAEFPDFYKDSSCSHLQAMKARRLASVPEEAT